MLNIRLVPVTARTRLALSASDARAARVSQRDALKRAVGKQVDRVAELQKVLYADGRFALLIILQGRDASGKDGTIKRVFRKVDPQGVQVTSFKVPSETERAHDFLWRVHANVPPRGVIGVFNRSHYEDVLVPRVLADIDRAECERRYREINDFERMLAEQGTVILKFFLHISRDEQKRQLQQRLDDPTKNWKFREGDLDDRRRWSDYTAAYRDALHGCSTKWAPWFVVPADDKDIRNLLVARTIAARLDQLGLRYPRASRRIRNLRIP